TRMRLPHPQHRLPIRCRPGGTRTAPGVMRAILQTCQPLTHDAVLPAVEGATTDPMPPAGQTHVLSMADMPAQPAIPFLRLRRERTGRTVVCDPVPGLRTGDGDMASV